GPYRYPYLFSVGVVDPSANAERFLPLSSYPDRELMDKRVVDLYAPTLWGLQIFNAQIGKLFSWHGDVLYGMKFLGSRMGSHMGCVQAYSTLISAIQ
ncbi:MAG: hypothetical protein O6909_01725, partial [Alphaproteobacteria bacterium]|nr:hypothetical protein [Alphaproteobacteria bacterium]